MYHAVLVGTRPGIYNDDEAMRAATKDEPYALVKSYRTAPEAVAEFASFVTRDPANSTVVVYTDGACVRNGTKNAAAGVGVFWGPGDARNVSRCVHGTPTNNVAELEAIEEAVQQILDTREPHVEYRVVSDSQYSIHALTTWFDRWARSGWRTSSGSPVKNMELIARVHGKLALLGDMVKLVHVRGHCGVRGNEMADMLATRACLGNAVPAV